MFRCFYALFTYFQLLAPVRQISISFQVLVTLSTARREMQKEEGYLLQYHLVVHLWSSLLNLKT